MQRSSDWAWAAAAIVAGLALVQCGARTNLTDDAEMPTLAAGGGADSSGASGGADSSGAGGGACEPSPPCAGSTGELAGSTGELAPYARLRTAPCGDVTVNRRGPPVPICHHIK